MSQSVSNLRDQVVDLCGANLFLSEDQKREWSDRVMTMPEEALLYLISVFSEFEDESDQVIRLMIENDDSGVVLNKFTAFKKSQIGKLAVASDLSDQSMAQDILSSNNI